MNTLTKFFKKYASGVLLLCILFSPLQSSAALLSEDIRVLRYQAELITEAINNSEAITQAKKSELLTVVDKINDLIALYALQVAADPNAVSQRRVNIENVIVTGNAKDFTSEAKVVWGPETVAGTSYNRSTSSYSYNFLTNLTETQKVERVRELVNLTFRQMSAELGFSPSGLKATSTISIKRFDDAQDALDNYTQPEVGAGLERVFGHFSVIDEIVITAGKDLFVIELMTDQDETITLSVTPKDPAPGLIYKITYAIYDTVRITALNDNANRAAMAEQLSYALPGIGVQFSAADQVVIDELLEFMLDHSVVYQAASVPPPQPKPDQANLELCHAPEIKQAVYDIFHYYIKNYQISENLVVNFGAPVEYVIPTGGFIPGCVNEDNSFFPSLSLN